MRTPRPDSESLQEALKLINHCPVCGKNYNTDRVRVFAKEASASLVHITCGSCQSSFVAMIVLLSHGLSSVGMVTDLNLADSQRLHRTGPVTIDEILEGYEALQSAPFESLLVYKS